MFWKATHNGNNDNYVDENVKPELFHPPPFYYEDSYNWAQGSSKPSTGHKYTYAKTMMPITQSSCLGKYIWMRQSGETPPGRDCNSQSCVAWKPADRSQTNHAPN